jgi:hypothetical protein
MGRRFPGRLALLSALVATLPARPVGAQHAHDSAAVQRFEVGKGTTLAFTPPRRLEFLRDVPGNLAGSARDAFRRENAWKAAGLAAATALLIAYDQRLFEETREFSRTIDLPASHPSIDFRAGGFKLFYLPTTVSSAMYYLGDGCVSVAVAGGFYGVGKLRGDYRALRTASEITESL